MNMAPAMNDETLPNALFGVSEDGSFVPTPFTRGPWRPDAQHGGPPCALLVQLAEGKLEAGEFLSHVEVELLRPVPLEPLVGVVERRRVSRRVHRVISTLLVHGEPVARANALVLATMELPAPGWQPDKEPATSPPSPDSRVEPPRWASGAGTTYHRNAMEHRFTAGTFREPGPAVDWQRLRLGVVDGQETTGLQRLAASADFGSGISAVYQPDSGIGLINANLTLSIFRVPEGEWISLDAVTHVGDEGTGLAVTMLGDVRGRVGIATQSLLGYRIEPE